MALEQAYSQPPLLVTYQLVLPPEKLNAATVESMANKIAIGQTVGTELAADLTLLSDYRATVADYRILPETTPEGEGIALIQIAFPLNTVISDIGTLTCVIFGKLSMSGKIRLVEIDVPPVLAERFGGPKFGLAGIRERAQVAEGPLLMSIFKPCLGLPGHMLAEKLFQTGLGGVNMVKDDEVISDPDFDSARRRLAACLAASEKVKQETGKPILYAINLSGPADTLLDRARTLARDGAPMLLFNYLCYGLPMLSALQADPAVNIPLMAHPSLAGAFYGSPWHGVSPKALFGQLPRLAGADLVLFPSPYGSVALGFEDAMRVKAALSVEMSGLKPSAVVPSAGIKASMVPAILKDFGSDVVINAGTGIHDHPQGSADGAREFVRAIRDYHAVPAV